MSGRMFLLPVTTPQPVSMPRFYSGRYILLLDITITPARLIDMAKDRSGLELQEMAADLGYHKSRITQLKKGTCALTPTEIKYYSDKAGLPFEQTISERPSHTIQLPDNQGIPATQ